MKNYQNLVKVVNANGEEVAALKLRIKTTHISDKERGLSFDAYKVLNGRGKWVDFRLTRDVAIKPFSPEKGQGSKECYVYVEPKYLNYTENYLYPRFWCRDIVNVEDVETKEQDVTAYFKQENE